MGDTPCGCDLALAADDEAVVAAIAELVEKDLDA
jgi:hypothetical protein